MVARRANGKAACRPKTGYTNNTSAILAFRNATLGTSITQTVNYTTTASVTAYVTFDKITQALYDADGNVTESDAYTDPSNASAVRATRYVYDFQDQPIMTIDPADERRATSPTR